MGKKPIWYKGKLVECDICGYWYGDKEGKLRIQRGLNVCQDCYDSLTEEQRTNNIQRRMR